MPWPPTWRIGLPTLGISPSKSRYNADDEFSDTEASCFPKSTTITSEAGNKSFDIKAFLAPDTATAMAIAPIAAEPAANTEAAEKPDRTEPLAEILDPEKTVATYGFVWHYDHNPVLVPQETIIEI